jgi:lipid II:glycine glycyltransferase (peptidoglycan interpeptide bridge formation enzyme)
MIHKKRKVVVMTGLTSSAFRGVSSRVACVRYIITMAGKDGKKNANFYVIFGIDPVLPTYILQGFFY